MTGSSFFPGIVYRAIRYYTDCEKCKKAKKNILTFFSIMICSAGTGMITALIYSMIGFQLGFTEWQLLSLSKLVMLMGMLAGAWWFVFNFDKIFCGCE